MSQLAGALRGGDEASTHPIGDGLARAFGRCGDQRVLVGGQPHSAQFGSRVVDAGSAGSHATNYSGHGKFRKGVDVTDFSGHTKYMTTTSTESRKAALFARTSTAALVASALLLDAKATKLTSEERLTRSWIFTELEARMGGVKDDDAFDALLDTDLTYTECLLVTFPELVA